MGYTAVPCASVAPPLACIDSIRPIPANRFQLTPHAGSASAIIRSALRYADNAIAGIRREPTELTTASGGGGAMMLASATWKLAGARATETTDGPDWSRVPGATAASGTTPVRWAAGPPAAESGEAATAAPSTSGARTIKPDLGVRAIRVARQRAHA